MVGSGHAWNVNYICVSLMRYLDSLSGRNGELSYTISHGNERRLFDVDQQTGVVTLAGRLDDVFGQSFHLVFTVKDRGSTERVAVSDLIVVVNASNNSPPASAHFRQRNDHCIIIISSSSSSSFLFGV